MVENPSLVIDQRLASLSLKISGGVEFVEEEGAGAGFVRQQGFQAVVLTSSALELVMYKFRIQAYIFQCFIINK